jgi:nitrilase
MPLLRHSLYSQNVNLYLAPTADGRDTWLPLMRTIACEGRCVVLSANQCITKANLPSWITGEKKEATNGVNGHQTATSPPKLRRKSTVTEDGNEIALPDRMSTSPPRLRRRSTVTEDGNEIVFPNVTHEAVIDETSESSPQQPKAVEFVSHGGSCIISPLGEVLAGPLWDDENGWLIVDVDFEDCLRGRLDLDVGGSYSRYARNFMQICCMLTVCRNDSFKLTVEGLDLSPPL